MHLTRAVSYGSGAFGTILFFIGIYILSTGNAPNIGVTILVMAIAIGVLPFTMIEYFHYKKFASIENRFPSFIRSLAENKKSGATFPQALDLAAKANYGVLSEEIRKTAAQVSWGVPFQKAILKMGENLKESPVIKQSMIVINEAFLSGGDVAGIMDSVSLNMNTIREVYEEKKAVLSQQSVIMYFVFFMFLGIAAILYRILIPIIATGSLTTSSGNLGLQPLDINQYCSIVPIICAIGTGLGFEPAGVYFQTLFFMMSMIQAVAIGLLSGYISQGKLSAGIKHSAIMVVATIVTFTVFL